MSEASSARTILLLAANPASTPKLDLDAEHRAILQCLERVSKRHNLRVVSEVAVTDDDLRRALLKHEPEIVHFSGHGSGRGGLVFEEAGEPLFISGEALAGLLRLCSTHVRCVVLNACYSEVQTKPIGSVVHYVIGMSRAIGDIAAVKFSTGFYDALASGRSYTDAFDFGCNAISLKGIPESLTPTLLVRGRARLAEDPVDENSGRESQREDAHQVGSVLSPSVKELISVLDFRAEVILSEMEKHDRRTSDVTREPTTEPTRDIKKVDGTKSRSRHARRFAKLHEQNRRALANGEFVLSHEITRQIQQFLYKLSEHTPFLYKLFYCKIIFYCLPRYYVSAGMYPGPLPESLKSRPTPAVLMWKQDEEEEYRAKKKRAEESSRRAAERAAEKVRWAKQRGLVMALQEAAKAKGVLKEGDRCPKCGFSYAWDGTDCYHCHYSKG
jgi:hypothetical protein